MLKASQFQTLYFKNSTRAGPTFSKDVWGNYVVWYPYNDQTKTFRVVRTVVPSVPTPIPDTNIFLRSALSCDCRCCIALFPINKSHWMFQLDIFCDSFWIQTEVQICFLFHQTPRSNATSTTKHTQRFSPPTTFSSRFISFKCFCCSRVSRKQT